MLIYCSTCQDVHDLDACPRRSAPLPRPTLQSERDWWSTPGRDLLLERTRREQKRDSYHRRKAKLAERTCANPECGSPFQPARRDQVYCLARCRDRAKYLRSRT